MSEDTLFGLTLASHAINLSKALTGPVMFGLILAAGNFNVGPIVYATMHAVYGILWVLKQVIFPDKNFMKKASEVVGFNLGVDLDVQNPLVEHLLFLSMFIGVDLYWLGGISLILSGNDVHPLRISFAVALYGFGIFLHFGADIQKFERLKHKKGLITDGFFAICRSPGFLGEILIYCAFFVMCPLGWMLYTSILVMILGVPSFIIGKERSISRYPEYAEYKSKTALLIPFVF